jgi:hypothetical protein
MLPCPPDAFAAFISSLLGRPQTISKSIRGTFDIDQNDISAFHHLVEQRLAQQNDSNLIQFTVRLVYDDGSSVLLNSHDDFLHYNEVRPVATVAAHLSWTYLVKFRDKTSPEKQQIDVAIQASRKSGIAIIDDLGPPSFIARSKGGNISFRIHHTARTWGADIEALLTAHVNSLLKTDGTARKWLQKHSGLVALATAGMLITNALVTAVLSANRFAQGQIVAARAIMRNPQASMAALVERTNSALEIVAAGEWPRFLLKILLFLIISTVVSIALAVWAASAADNERPSFVTLTKESSKRKEALLNSFRKSFRSFVFSVVVSILTGLAGNYLFA